jgi:hypothetical protein
LNDDVQERAEEGLGLVEGDRLAGLSGQGDARVAADCLSTGSITGRHAHVVLRFAADPAPGRPLPEVEARELGGGELSRQVAALRAATAPWRTG